MAGNKPSIIDAGAMSNQPRSVSFSANSMDDTPSRMVVVHPSTAVGSVTAKYIDPATPADSIDSYFRKRPTHRLLQSKPNTPASNAAAATRKARSIKSGGTDSKAVGPGSGGSGSGSGGGAAVGSAAVAMSDADHKTAESKPIGSGPKFSAEIAEAKRQSGSAASKARAYARAPSAPAFSHMNQPPAPKSMLIATAAAAEKAKQMLAAAAAKSLDLTTSATDFAREQLRKDGLLVPAKLLPHAATDGLAITSMRHPPTPPTQQAMALASLTAAMNAASAAAISTGSGGSGGGGMSTPATRSLSELESALSAARSIASNKALINRLPDGGSKLRSQIVDLERRIDAQRATIRREVSELGEALNRMAIEPAASASASGGGAVDPEAQRKARAAVDTKRLAAAIESEQKTGYTTKWLKPLSTLSLNEASFIEREQTILARQEFAARELAAAQAASAPAPPGGAPFKPTGATSSVPATGIEASIAAALKSVAPTKQAASASAMDDIENDPLTNLGAASDRVPNRRGGGGGGGGGEGGGEDGDTDGNDGTGTDGTDGTDGDGEADRDTDDGDDGVLSEFGAGGMMPRRTARRSADGDDSDGGEDDTTNLELDRIRRMDEGGDGDDDGADD